ncbi:hypothetical protein ACHAXT_012081 [Thalassiosira profunda]
MVLRLRSPLQEGWSVGIVDIKTSKAATAWIVAFAGVFAGLAGVVYKLRKDIQEAKSSPLLEKEDSQEDQALS